MKDIVSKRLRRFSLTFSLKTGIQVHISVFHSRLLNNITSVLLFAKSAKTSKERERRKCVYILEDVSRFKREEQFRAQCLDQLIEMWPGAAKS